MVLSCSIEEEPGVAVEMAAGELQPGLFRGHLYSILGCATTPSGQQLIKLRNPWGHSEWRGAWEGAR